MREIRLTKGQVAIVDDDMYEWLSQYHWKAVWRKGTQSYVASAKIDGHSVYMHRLITRAPKGTDVDHIRHNTLDNRRENLRVCKHAHNSANRRKPRTGLTSRYKGVCWINRRKKWEAAIEVNHKRLWLGYHTDEEAAAHAYDAAAIKHFGEFANLNFPAA